MGMEIITNVNKSYDTTQKRVILDESPRYLSTNEVTKTNTIIVNDLVVVITQINGAIGIRIKVSVAPLPDGSIPLIDFNLSDEPINFSEEGFRLTKLTSVIQKQAYTQYPEAFKSEDPDVIVNNYSLEVRKDDESFPDFRNTVLDTLVNVFNIEV